MEKREKELIEHLVFPKLYELGYSRANLEVINKEAPLRELQGFNIENRISRGNHILIQVDGEYVGVLMLGEIPGNIIETAISKIIRRDYFTKEWNKGLYNLSFLFAGMIIHNSTHAVWETCLLSNTGQPKICSLEDIHIHNFIPTIEEIHQKSFQYLYQKYQEDNSLTFHLRTRNNANRLEQGYYFLGNEDYCAISFWTGRDWKNKIYFL